MYTLEISNNYVQKIIVQKNYLLSILFNLHDIKFLRLDG